MSVQEVLRSIFHPTKARLWIDDLKELLASSSRVTGKPVETLVGRLNHIGHILPTGRYFLNRIRFLLQKIIKYGAQHIQEPVREDMKLWEDFISHACSTGVIINDICYTQWTRTIITDACEHGIGGFCVETDRAWRYRLPPELIGRLHINIIEFCASVIGIWVELNEYAGPHPRFMTLFDSTSVLRWLHKSNFNLITHKRHDIVARKLARLLLKH